MPSVYAKMGRFVSILIQFEQTLESLLVSFAAQLNSIFVL